MRLRYHQWSYKLSKNQSQRIGHSEDEGGHGSLTLSEPVLADLGGDTGYEGTAHASESLAEDGEDEGRPVGPPVLASPDPR